MTLESKIEHTGFCMGDYDEEKCKDCPSLDECLDLYIHELIEQKRAEVQKL